MQTETGKIVRGNRALADGVTVQLHADPRPRVTDWSGRFTLPAGRTTELGKARLELADGRCGDVVLYKQDRGKGQTIVVDFWGLGSLKPAV